MPIRAYIGLGANLGDPRETIQAALRELAATADLTVLKVAPLYASAPIDSTGPNYINTVVSLDTSLGPQELLAMLQKIELLHGR